MEQYISKAAVVAEIERRIYVLKTNESVISMLAGGMFVNEFKDLLSFLNTLDTKEVDLEKEMDEWRHNHFCGARDDKGAAGEWLTRKSQLDIAKHFYELGLKAKGE